MTDKELRRLSRGELLEMLLAQTRENEKLKKQLGELQAQLDSRRIEISQSGSIAEAALRLNGVFQAAEASAAQYLQNVQRLSDEQEAEYRRMEAEAREKAETICAAADTYSLQVRARADQYLRQVEKKTQAFLREQSGGRSPLRSGEEEP